MTKKVYIVRPHYEYTSMFLDQGWKIADTLDDADLVVFTGGEDVSPNLYGEETHPRTYKNPLRDQDEAEIYHLAVALGIPLAGICRGGQFLNVMNGGRMYQDVNNHAIGGTHAAFIPGIGQVHVTSTHHQMMRRNVNVEHIVLMTANLSTRRDYMVGKNIVSQETMGVQLGDDLEAIYYPGTKTLCFQPHPEFSRSIVDTRDVFFFFLRNFPLAETRFEEGVKFINEVKTLGDNIR